MQKSSQKHLDLGCGDNPRNPYNKEYLFGIDIRTTKQLNNATFKQANLILEKIPFDDDFFGSISAFDFLEHIPRVFPTFDGKSTTFPFVNLMSEVWRVLINKGRFYALTPAYPNIGAFQDPTHVNFITEDTHKYFCDEFFLGNMYGFTGKFRLIRCEWVQSKYAYDASKKVNFIHKLQTFSKLKRGKICHLLWELEAVK